MWSEGTADSILNNAKNPDTITILYQLYGYPFDTYHKFLAKTLTREIERSGHIIMFDRAI